MSRSFGRAISAVIGVVILAVLCVLSAVPALATPSDPIMSLGDLQAKLDASPDGTVPGYMKTVMRGKTIDTIPVTVYAVLDGGTSGYASGAAPYILFEATGPKIEAIGSIASGMSGSPIYVNDGADEVIGAVSYGDCCTKGGMGLATPIEAMASLESGYGSTGYIPLAQTVEMRSGAPVDGVLVTGAGDAPGSPGPTTAVMRPLAMLSVGGLDPRSPVFAGLDRRLKAKGSGLVPIVQPLGTGGSSFETTLEPGAAVAAMGAHGALWFGGVGTVTYTCTDTVVAFGHDMFGIGHSGWGLHNAWVDGVWPSTCFPYKLTSPGVLRGTFTQDRSVGILGRTDEIPSEATITSTARFADDGRTHTAVTYMPSWAIDRFDGPDYWYGISSVAAYVAGAEACDVSWGLPGSGRTTTTVEVSDGTDTYVIQRRNVFDDPEYIQSAIVEDVTDIVGSFQSINGNGVAHADIRSIDLESEITAERNLAEIVSVDVTRGLVVGPNRVRVSFLKHGDPDTQTVEVTLTIPAGTSMKGSLSAGVVDEGWDEESWDYEEDIWGDYYYYDSVDRTTVAELAADLSEFAPNSELEVRYEPDPWEPDWWEDEAPTRPTSGYDPVETTSSTGWYLCGGWEKAATQMTAYLSPRSTSYNGSTRVVGQVVGLEDTGTVVVTGRYSGQTTEAVLRSATISSDDEGYFSIVVSGLKKNMELTVRFVGDRRTLPCEKQLTAYVRAGLSLSSSSYSVRKGARVTLRTRVSPAETTGTVTFQRYSRGAWRTLSTRAIVSGAASLTTGRLYSSTRYRVWFRGGPYNIGSYSRSIYVRVR